MWETLSHFIMTNREEIYKTLGRNYYFVLLGISWDDDLSRVRVFILDDG